MQIYHCKMTGSYKLLILVCVIFIFVYGVYFFSGQSNSDYQSDEDFLSNNREDDRKKAFNSYWSKTRKTKPAIKQDDGTPTSAHEDEITIFQAPTSESSSSTSGNLDKHQESFINSTRLKNRRTISPPRIDRKKTLNINPDPPTIPVRQQLTTDDGEFEDMRGESLLESRALNKTLESQEPRPSAAHQNTRSQSYGLKTSKRISKPTVAYSGSQKDLQNKKILRSKTLENFKAKKLKGKRIELNRNRMASRESASRHSDTATRRRKGRLRKKSKNVRKSMGNPRKQGQIGRTNQNNTGIHMSRTNQNNRGKNLQRTNQKSRRIYVQRTHNNRGSQVPRENQNKRQRHVQRTNQNNRESHVPNDPQVHQPTQITLSSLVKNKRVRYSQGFTNDSTFYREVMPLNMEYKRSVLLLHSSKFTSKIWIDIGTMATLGSKGYRTVAIDKPGAGRSANASIPYSKHEIIIFMIKLIQGFGFNNPIIVSPSSSGEYLMPLLMEHSNFLGGVVLISPTHTSDYSTKWYEQLRLPALVLLGKEDRSMLNWASLDNLEHLGNKRIFSIENTTNEFYVDKPATFHRLVLMFLNSLKTHS